jgi:hypothetical protein
VCYAKINNLERQICTNITFNIYETERKNDKKTEYLYEVVFVDVLKYMKNIFNQNLASHTEECVIASKVI